MGNEGTIESELNTGRGEEMKERGDEGKLISFLLFWGPIRGSP